MIINVPDSIRINLRTDILFHPSQHRIAIVLQDKFRQLINNIIVEEI